VARCRHSLLAAHNRGSCRSDNLRNPELTGNLGTFSLRQTVRCQFSPQGRNMDSSPGLGVARVVVNPHHVQTHPG
jgi:hypothetical protein